MVAIADGGLRHTGQECHGAAQQQWLRRPAATPAAETGEFLFEHLLLEPIGVYGALYHDPIR